MTLIRIPALLGLVLMFMVLGGQIADFPTENVVLTTMVVPDLADSAEPLPMVRETDLHALQEPNSASDHLSSDNRWIITAKVDNLPAADPPAASINSGATVLDLIAAISYDTGPAPDAGAATVLITTEVPDKTIEDALGMA